MRKKECVAMILAGGQGSRLGALTKNIAKPAVPFGGKYRIIDFTLSNCSNSGIDTVGVLTQYQPLILNTYIGIGSSWDLDRNSGGVILLPPFAKERTREWYSGTANAIYQNINFIDSYDPEFVLVLSGDHIYKMDYSLMLEFHKKNQSQATIAVKEVPWEEASRFGIMNTDVNYKITEFEEKPEQPKSNLASMGIYIFDWKLLKEYLEKDENNPNSSNDFGKDVIPMMLSGGVNIFAYPFNGYWKDVGTIESLWEANMELIAEESHLNLRDEKWKIYSANGSHPPHLVGPEAKITMALVNDGCAIWGYVEHSVIFTGVHIGQNSYVKDSIIMPNVKIGANVRINRAIIGEETIVEDNSIIGFFDDHQSKDNAMEIDSKIIVIEEQMIIRNNTMIKKSTA